MYRKCMCVAALCLTLAIAGNAAAELGQGKVLFEYWDNVGGTSVDGNLRTNANFPGSPSSSVWLDNFQSPSGRADNYGVRGRAFLTPPETGEYTFWVAGDDNCQLWLSTDDTAENAAMIAQVAAWSGVAEWTKEAGQKSAPVALVAGQKYYIEALMKEGGGGDSLEVGWAGPGVSETPVILAGQYCTAIIRNPEPLLFARNPNPADNASGVTSSIFECIAGITAVSHSFYLGTSPTLTEADLQPALAPGTMFYYFGAFDPGVTYYWRVDEVDADGTTYTGAVWSFTTLADFATAPAPADGGEDVSVLPTLSWTAGEFGVGHVVYLSKDEALVAAADASVMVADQDGTSFAPAQLDPLATYFWRVDEVTDTNDVIAGPVWSFSTVNYYPIVSGQASLVYANRLAPFMSALSVDTPVDLTVGGQLAELVVNFLGRAERTSMVGAVVYDANSATYSVTGAGADIWNNADEFNFAYKTLDGDGSMIARVTDIGTGTDAWSKGGVMIRQSLAANSTYAIVALTGGNGGGGGFQWRPSTGVGATAGADPAGIIPGYWVKVERTGDTFRGFFSPDGETWTQQGTDQTIPMTGPALIGLAVTSHVNATTERTFKFDNVSTTGNVSPEGEFTAFDYIPVIGNDAAPITVSIEDAAGAVATVAYSDPAASLATEWQQWIVPLSDFAGVDAANAVKVQLAVGDGQAQGTGIVTFADVRTIPPTSKGTVVWVSFHGTDAPSAAAAGVGFTEAPDKAYTDLLKAAGYDVVRMVQTGSPDLAVLNAADLVIVGRSVASGSFQNANATTWNGVTAPMMITGGYIARKNRMGFYTGSTIPDTTGDITLTVTDPTHPIFEGISLTDGTMDNPYCGLAVYPTDGTTAAGLSIVTEPIAAGGTLLASVSAASATTGPAGAVVIAEYPAGTSLVHDGGAGTDVLAGPRLVFLTGARENGGKTSETAGMFDLSEDGALMFLNAVAYMIQ